jgi:type IV pilus assembly protein PilN
MRLKINLATRTYIDAHRLNAAVAAIVVLLLLGLFFSVRAVATTGGEIRLAGTELALLQGKGTGKGKVEEKEYQALLARIGAANAIIARKSYDWLQLLDRLEGVVPDGVAMTAIEPEPKGNSLKLTGVARSFAELRRFMETLEDARFLTDVYLNANAETKVGESQRGMTFSITCRVVPQ